jgi:trehalose utilization protein
LARSKLKTLRSHREKNKVPSKKEKKKEKMKVVKNSVDWAFKPNLTLADIKAAYPKMHLRDALRKIAEIKSGVKNVG